MNKLVVCLLLATAMSSYAGEQKLTVKVESAGEPVTNAQVKLWQAKPGVKPTLIAEDTTKEEGYSRFDQLTIPQEGFYYFTSNGGEVRGQSASHYAGLAVLTPKQAGDVVINEISTVGSLWPLASQFTGDHSISGSPTGLLIGSEHVGNLTDVTKGDFGATVLDGSNLTFSETVGRMNTLSALMATCGATQKTDSCKELLSITGGSNTLTALHSIATAPYANTDKLFKLFTKSYPYPKGEGRRNTSFLPYLEWEPKDFSLMVRLTGGGTYSPGRLMFDNRGQLWSGQNWMPGSQSNLSSSIGGGVVRLAPDGTAISPRLTGYDRQGLDGIGWGTTVSNNKVWVSSFNNKIGVLDLDGNALGPASVQGENGALQGLATSTNGDVWVCDNQMNQMIRFPKGDHTKGEVIKVPGLKRPFAVAVDNNDIVWVTNNGFITVTRFPASAPEKAEQIQLGGMAPRGLAIDSSGHVWVGNNFSMGYPIAKVPEGASVLEEFKLNIEKVLKNEANGINQTGNITLIDPEGTVIQKAVLEGELYAPWGVSIDGKDNVFVGNFFGTGFVHICGTNPSNCPKDKKTGDLIHSYQSGILQESTDTMVDDAGNVWMANNWDVVHALVDENPDRRTATRGGGTGMVVIYGIGAPVTNPLIGQVRVPKFQ